jgi:antitoxin component YwqK of YwqJK toxin-antitoxin module
MRKEQLDNWIKNGGKLPENLTENEKSHLESLGWRGDRLHYEGGQLQWEGNFLNDKKHGVSRWWHKNGRLYWDSNHLHGKGHGVQRMWTDDGELFEHKEYAYGVFLKDYLK